MDPALQVCNEIGKTAHLLILVEFLQVLSHHVLHSIVRSKPTTSKDLLAGPDQQEHLSNSNEVKKSADVLLLNLRLLKNTFTIGTQMILRISPPFMMIRAVQVGIHIWSGFEKR